ncbi:MAG: hypothetical protein U0Q16_04470 [Bryobacteraceae bacterium]
MACTWAIGYFHQVTHLRGKIVGAAPGDIRGWFRWSRQMVARSDAKLSLYRYQWPRDMHGKPIKEVAAGKNGEFDFGELPVGHYSLALSLPAAGAEFDVETIKRTVAAKSVLIDISPVLPDCSGGHEFIASND